MRFSEAREYLESRLVDGMKKEDIYDYDVGYKNGIRDAYIDALGVLEELNESISHRFNNHFVYRIRCMARAKHKRT